ncbi:hypothetical protein ACF09J_13970 [Streptomyces sp. NPDC014889]|uniref:hypothetical protein n=1 Tax=Streptomyces sp. NPDC014889 TaxID=3364928 RepID=UPI0036FE1436
MSEQRETLVMIVREWTEGRGFTPVTPAAVVDAYRAEVLAEDGQAYDGELAMYRELVRTLRIVVRSDDADMGEVRRLLHHHASDDAAAHAEGKSSHPADATPTGPTGRVGRLLDAIRTGRGRWTTTRAAQFYRDARLGPPGATWTRIRTVARGDLRDLAAWGHLLRHEEPGRQYFTLKTRKGGNV